ncbi:MAG: hypothetical protein IPP94_14420 [Ignavibacteria bacterium]|nr:hypothetical protein [Ignavibacteria bacterium]
MTGIGNTARTASRAEIALALYGEPKRFTAFIGALLLLTLQFQTLPFNVNVQLLPLTTALALLFFPFIVRDIPRSPLLSVIGLFTGYAVLHSMLALGVDMMANPGDIRFYAWFRQLVAVLAGVVTYLVLRSCMLAVEDRDVIRYMILGAIPSLLLAGLNIVWGTLGLGWAGEIVKTVRSVVSPEGFTSPMRATGFATEPASLATSLVTVLLPVFLYELGTRRPSMGMLFVLVLSLLAFSWAFSLTGVLLLLLVLISGVILGPSRKMLSILMVSFVALSVAGIVLSPGNQIMRHLTVLSAGGENISFTDRYYSAFGPFLSIFTSWSSVGYGLGGVATHFTDVIPPDVALEIVWAKQEGLPSLTSIFGRVFAETGIIGWLLFLSMFVVAFRSVAALLKAESSPEKRRLYACFRIGLVAVVFSLFFSIGPYHTPYLWLWIALIDSRYIIHLRNTRTGTLPDAAPRDSDLSA